MAAAQKIIRTSAQKLGISYHARKTAAHGTYRSYTVLIHLEGSESTPKIFVSLCVSSMGAPLNVQEVAACIPEAAGCSCAMDKYLLCLSFPIKGKQSDMIDRIVDTVRIVIDYLERHTCDNCDEAGNTGATSVYWVKGRYAFLTDLTAQYVQKKVAEDADRNALQTEKFLPGLMGALLGSLVGAVIVFIVARIGFVSTLSSAVLGFAIVLGYKKLAGKISIPSAVLCVALSVVVTYLVFRLDAAITFYIAVSKSSLPFSFGDCLAHTKTLYTLVNTADTYFRNLLIMMLADVLTAIAAVSIEYSSQKEQFTMYRL